MTLISLRRGVRVIPLPLIPDSGMKSGQGITVSGFARAENQVWKDRILETGVILCDAYIMECHSTLITVSLPPGANGIKVGQFIHPQNPTRVEWRILTLPSAGEVADLHNRMPVVSQEE